MKSNYCAVEVRGRGGPEVLQIVERKRGKLSAKKVRVKTTYLGVAFGDKMRRMGVFAPFGPFTPGYDFVGEIIEVGKKVDPSLLGQKVAGIMPKIGIGGYSQEIEIDPANTIPVPSDLCEKAILALGVNYISAHHLLTKFIRVDSSTNVFIHGISGNVGMALMDFRTIFHHKMSGTCSEAKVPGLQAMGAKAYGYNRTDWKEQALQDTPAGFDLVIDGLGFHNLKASSGLLGKNGVLFFFGLTNDAQKGMKHVTKGLLSYVGLLLQGTRLKNYLFGMSRDTRVSDCLETWQVNLALYRQGRLNPKIGPTFDFADIKDAHQAMDAGVTSGKITLRVG